MPDVAVDAARLVELMSDHPVLGQLDAAAAATLAAHARVHAFAAGERLAPPGELAGFTGWTLDGRVRLHDPDLDLSVSLGPGGLFGFGATPTGPLGTWEAVAASDGQWVRWPPQALIAACEGQRALHYFFPSLTAATAATASDDASPGLLSAPLRNWIHRAPVTAPTTATIRAASERMRDERVSSLLLLNDGQLAGIVTDRDLRNRVVAQGLRGDEPVSAVASAALQVIDAAQPAYEALMLMTRLNIHHVPLMDGDQVAGLVTLSDLTRHFTTSAGYMAREIGRQDSVDGLARISAKVPQLQRDLAAAQASAYSTGHIVTSITDAITRRLLAMAQAELGPPPVPFAWVAAGSQARNEQAARSDQDNCLILDDAYDEAHHGSYFRELSRRVCDGLNACGYVYCPGEMMAMTDTWRQPLRRWAQYFRGWVDAPEPKALMLTCVFFDLRLIDGDAALLDGLRTDVLSRTRGNSLFLAHMVGNALKHRPPLGMFGGLSVTRQANGKAAIDLKHGGIVPIVDLARVYALAGALPAVNTHDRLERSADAGVISEASARDLREALEFLFKLRIAHQARQMAMNVRADNSLLLEELSGFERSHLKDAFGIVKTLQEVLAQRYQGGSF